MRWAALGCWQAVVPEKVMTMRSEVELGGGAPVRASHGRQPPSRLGFHVTMLDYQLLLD